MSLKNPLPVATHFADTVTLASPIALRPGAMAARPARVLVLFGADWDGKLLPRYQRTGRYRFHEHGFDLFSFPSNARLMWFDLWRFVDRMVCRYHGRVDAVFSSNEQFGALAAALVAERLALPGVNPASLLRAQHKYEARLRLRAVAPDLCPDFELIPYSITLDAARRLRYPLFVKPVKATFSVLARRCDSPEQLIEHLRSQQRPHRAAARAPALPAVGKTHHRAPDRAAQPGDQAFPGVSGQLPAHAGRRTARRPPAQCRRLCP